MNRSSPTPAECDYCGLPVHHSVHSAGPVYCCHGCRFAAAICSPSNDSPAILGPASALGLSIFCSMNVVMLTMALWSYADATQSDFEIALREFLRYGAMLFSLPVLILLGRPLASHAFSGLRQGVFTTDLLLTTGVGAAYAVSIANTIRGQGHVYFEVGCVILVLVTLGRWLEAEGRSRASAALDSLERLLPATVRLLSPFGEVTLLRSLVAVGDTIRVLAGERIPVDGRLVRGRAVVDEQFFTGESAPAEKRPGDSLLGGSLNLDGDLVIAVTATSSAGALGRLVDAVRTARISKGRYQRLSDLWSQCFFPLISVIAVGTFFFHGLRTDWEHGLLTALSVVLIACPCALALATPLAVWTAMGTLASKGILCRSGAALEKMANVKAIRWDKTGTLTTGSPRVDQFLCERPDQQEEVLQRAKILTAASNHVYSQSIAAYITEVADVSPDQRPTQQFAAEGDHAQSPKTLANHQDQTTSPVHINSAIERDIVVYTFGGRGLLATTTSGNLTALGSLRWMSDNQLIAGPRLKECLPLSDVAEEGAANDARRSGDVANTDQTVVAIGYDQMIQGLFILEETLRPESVEIVREMHRLGYHQAVLTGDRIARAVDLSHKLDLEVKAELLPEQKLEAIRQAHREYGVVAMIGDGLNDAPALAAADIGIALGCGADVSRESADICLLSSDLRLIPWLFQFSRQTVRTIRSNLVWSFAYNSVGVVLAASGQLHPALAAVLMVVSSLVVLGNSLKLSLIDAPDLAVADSLDDSLCSAESASSVGSTETSP